MKNKEIKEAKDMDVVALVCFFQVISGFGQVAAQNCRSAEFKINCLKTLRFFMSGTKSTYITVVTINSSRI